MAMMSCVAEFVSKKVAQDAYAQCWERYTTGQRFLGFQMPESEQPRQCDNYVVFSIIPGTPSTVSSGQEKAMTIMFVPMSANEVVGLASEKNWEEVIKKRVAAEQVIHSATVA